MTNSLEVFMSKDYLNPIYIVLGLFIWMMLKDISKNLYTKDQYEKIKQSKLYKGYNKYRSLGFILILTGTLAGFVVGIVLAIYTNVMQVLEVRSYLTIPFLQGEDREKLIHKSENLLGVEELESLAKYSYQNLRSNIGTMFIIAKNSSLEDLQSSGVSLGDLEINDQTLKVVSAIAPRNYLIRDNHIVQAAMELPSIDLAEYEEYAHIGKEFSEAVAITDIYDCVVVYLSGHTGKFSLFARTKEGLKTYLGLDIDAKAARGLTYKDIEELIGLSLSSDKKDLRQLDLMREPSKPDDEEELEVEIS